MNKMYPVLFGLLLATAAVSAQEEEKQVELKIVVAGEAGEDGSEMHWISDDLDFDPAELAVGESRTLTGKSGDTVTVTRTEAGIKFDIEGESIEIPHMPQHGTQMAFVGMNSDHEMDVQVLDGEEVDVRIIGDGPHIMRAHHPDGVTIISETPLDDSVKESIRSVLISAGVDDEVTFVDGSDGGRHVRVIKKSVEIVQ